MSNHNEANTICLLGEIVSIYEKDGIQYAKIHYDPGYVDLIFQEVQDVFLNDRVVVHSSFEVESISTNIENDHSHLK